jgi:hypothetical protein
VNPEELTITEAEADLGFELVRLPNPHDLLFGQRFTPVVCRKLSRSSFVFKERSLADGSIYYKHRIYGRAAYMPENREAEWLQVGIKTFADPAEALHECKLALEKQLASLRVIPCPVPKEK